MKKIMVVLNGTLTPQHLINFSINLSRSTSSLLHAVFINYASDLAEYNYPFFNDLHLTRNNLTGKTIAAENLEILESSIRLFKHKCETSKIDFYIEPGTTISLETLLDHSAFSDIILADANESSVHKIVVDLLAGSHCPVYLVSKDVEKTENNILAYDGSFSSIYAIKMFTYLFPELKNLPGYLVYISPDKNDELPKEKKIMPWLSRHYPNAQIKILHGNARDELTKYTGSIPNSLVVMGSFGRSATSRFFQKSLATTLIKDDRTSLFIGHK